MKSKGIVSEAKSDDRVVKYLEGVASGCSLARGKPDRRVWVTMRGFCGACGRRSTISGEKGLDR